MSLIDKKELKEWVENWFYQNKYYHPYSKSNNIPCSELYDILERMPTVDAVPVKFIYESADLLRKCADEHGARVLYMLIENWNRADGERKDGERRTE